VILVAVAPFAIVVWAALEPNSFGEVDMQIAAPDEVIAVIACSLEHAPVTLAWTWAVSIAAKPTARSWIFRLPTAANASLWLPTAPEAIFGL
jgi:hypothetical protein